VEATPALFINNKQFRGAPHVLLFQQILDAI
jgi:protein-disulfide isomerase